MKKARWRWSTVGTERKLGGVKNRLPTPIKNIWTIKNEGKTMKKRTDKNFQKKQKNQLTKLQSTWAYCSQPLDPELNFWAANPRRRFIFFLSWSTSAVRALALSSQPSSPSASASSSPSKFSDPIPIPSLLSAGGSLLWLEAVALDNVTASPCFRILIRESACLCCCSCCVRGWHLLEIESMTARTPSRARRFRAVTSWGGKEVIFLMI